MPPTRQLINSAFAGGKSNYLLRLPRPVAQHCLVGVANNTVVGWRCIGHDLNAASVVENRRIWFNHTDRIGLARSGYQMATAAGAALLEGQCQLCGGAWENHQRPPTPPVLPRSRAVSIDFIGMACFPLGVKTGLPARLPRGGQFNHLSSGVAYVRSLAGLQSDSRGRLLSTGGTRRIRRDRRSGLMPKEAGIVAQQVERRRHLAVWPV